MIYYLFFLIFIIEIVVVKFFQQQMENKYKQMGFVGIVKSRFDNIFLFFTFWELLILYSLRELPSDTEHDLGRYVAFFHYIADGAAYSFLEPGFTLYIKICASVSDSTAFILFAYSTPVILLVWWFIKKYSKNVYLSVYFYYGFAFYFFLFNGVRQCLAMAIGLPAFYFIDSKKWVKAFLTIVLAAQFHQSAWILLLLFPISLIRIKIDLRYFSIVVILFVILIGLGKVIVEPLTAIFASKYVGYVMSNDYGGVGNIANPLIYLVIIAVICSLYNENNRNSLFLINSLVVGTLIYALSTQIQILNRMTYYFTIPIICILPNIISEIKNSQARLIAIIGCYVSIIIYGFVLVMNNANGILPYVFDI